MKYLVAIALVAVTFLLASTLGMKAPSEADHEVERVAGSPDEADPDLPADMVDPQVGQRRPLKKEEPFIEAPVVEPDAVKVTSTPPRLGDEYFESKYANATLETIEESFSIANMEKFPYMTEATDKLLAEGRGKRHEEDGTVPDLPETDDKHSVLAARPGGKYVLTFERKEFPRLFQSVDEMRWLLKEQERLIAEMAKKK